MENNKKPKLFLVLRIIGFCLLAVGVILLITSFTMSAPGLGESGWFEAASSKNGIMFGGIACIMFSIVFIIWSFIPQLGKIGIKTAKYMQQENKEDLKDMANTSADIMGDAITNTVKAVKRGLNDSKYCRFCGEEISADSVFCSKCGKQQ